MPLILTMPKLSPTMEAGVIIKWHKAEGDPVQPGDLLVEVATDKATVEHQALDEGWLRQIIVKNGQDAIVNQPIAILTAALDEPFEPYQPKVDVIQPNELPSKSASLTTTISSEQVAPARLGSMPQPQFIPELPIDNYRFEYASERLEGRILASPLAKKIAKERNLDLTTVRGTGPHQRIMSRDLEKAQPYGIVNFNRRETPTLSPGYYVESPLSPMRKVIGKRLQEAKTFIPHFYVSQIIDAEFLTAMHAQFKANDIKLSINDFVVRACALALRKHPEINRGFNSVNETIVEFKTIDIAVAVSVDGGLITPIVRHADYKNIGELAIEIRDLAKRAREGKLELQDYKGGSFTISNLGMYGVSEFQAILNPPQAAILAVSAILDTPVVRSGVVVAGKTFKVTLSVDHRVIDGATAALFLQTLKKFIENPSILCVY